MRPPSQGAKGDVHEWRILPWTCPPVCVNLGGHGVKRERMDGNSTTQAVIGAAITVHRELGPGLLESTYHACLEHELNQRGVKVESGKAVRVVYRGISIECGYRIDLLVENAVVVELKSVRCLDPIHTAQLLTYMRLSGVRLGLLINFNVFLLKDGVRRYVL